jgi:Circularly permutated YpsA SLOG family
LTRNLCTLLKRPYLLINVSETPDAEEAAANINQFIEEYKIETLNVAGPWASGWNEGYQFTFDVVGKVIQESGVKA